MHGAEHIFNLQCQSAQPPLQEFLSHMQASYVINLPCMTPTMLRPQTKSTLCNK